MDFSFLKKYISLNLLLKVFESGHFSGEPLLLLLLLLLLDMFDLVFRGSDVLFYLFVCPAELQSPTQSLKQWWTQRRGSWPPSALMLEKML